MFACCQITKVTFLIRQILLVYRLCSKNVCGLSLLPAACAITACACEQRVWTYVRCCVLLVSPAARDCFGDPTFVCVCVLCVYSLRVQWHPLQHNYLRCLFYSISALSRGSAVNQQINTCTLRSPDGRHSAVSWGSGYLLHIKLSSLHLNLSILTKGESPLSSFTWWYLIRL